MFSNITAKLYHNLWGRLQDNPDLRRYYLYRLFTDMASGGKANFAMSYLYFHLGVSVEQVVVIMMTYAMSCLLILKPVTAIINRVGVRRAYALHFIPSIMASAITIYIAMKGSPAGWFWPCAWMFVHAWNIMLDQIPTMAYFSHFGRPETRGADLGLATVFQRIASIGAPILFGYLLADGGMVAFVVVQSLIGLLAGFALGLKKDDPIHVDEDVFKLHKFAPKNFTLSFFVQNLPYAFTQDLFFIWLVMKFGGDYKTIGIFYGMRLALDMLLSWLIGKYSDAGRVRLFYILAVMLTSVFWLIMPFADFAWQIAALQFTLGLMRLAIDIPYEREYHNQAKQSGRPLAWSIWRMVSIESGLAVGSVFALLIVSHAQDWHWFMLLGAPAILSYLWVLPQKNHSKSSV